MSRILLVEDGREIASLLLGPLQRAGHEVEQLGDGAAALERILHAPPALTRREQLVLRALSRDPGRVFTRATTSRGEKGLQT